MPESWQSILHLYISQQRNRIAAAYAAGSWEFDGWMDGLLILERHLCRPMEDIAFCIGRRQKASEAMISDGWSYGSVRRHMAATTQILSGGEIALAAIGGSAVSERARLRCKELAALLAKDGKEAA